MRYGEGPKIRNGGKSASSPSATTWNSSSAPESPANRCDPEQGHSFGQHQRGCRLPRDDHLTTMGSRADPGHRVDRKTDITRVGQLRPPAVDGGAYAYLDLLGPCVSGYRSLHGDGGPTASSEVRNTPKYSSPWASTLWPLAPVTLSSMSRRTSWSRPE